jgi:glycosyltransferase involved in cell wall biosynthesis
MYSALLSLRKALALDGVDLRWVNAGRSIGEQARLYATSRDLEIGCLLAPGTDAALPRARALLDYVAGERPDILFIDVFGGPLEANLVRYVPPDVLRIMIVHSTSRSTYRAARSVRGWVDATVAVSPRIREDLIGGQGFRPEAVHVIPNSVEIGAGKRSPDRRGELRVVTHGRVEHSSKGVNWIPEILRDAIGRGLSLSLTVSGEGPDLEGLTATVSRLGLARRVTFPGFVPRERVPELMLRHDVLLLPSIFEGLSLSLLEAMTAGCVPVASRIRGVTDYAVADGRTGFLFRIGDTRAAADRLVQLGRDRRELASMSDAARHDARARFGTEEQASAYERLIGQVRSAPRRVRPPLPIERWRLPYGLRPGWWRILPAPVKDLLRTGRERLRFGAAG